MGDVEIEQYVPRRLSEQFGIAEDRRAISPQRIAMQGEREIAPLRPLRALGIVHHVNQISPAGRHIAQPCCNRRKLIRKGLQL